MHVKRRRMLEAACAIAAVLLLGFVVAYFADDTSHDCDYAVPGAALACIDAGLLKSQLPPPDTEYGRAVRKNLDNNPPSVKRD